MNFKLSIHRPKAANRLSPNEIELGNKCFDFWKQFWLKIYTDNGAAAHFKPDEFFRQDMVGVITYGDEVAALWGQTLFNINSHCALDLNYFKFYNEEYIQWLRDHDIQDVMSTEFFSVDPKFRKSAMGASMARVMFWISSQLFKASHAQALLATARVDVGIAHLTYEVGYECVVGNTMQRNFPCDLVACRKDKVKLTTHQPSLDLANQLWSEYLSTKESNVFPLKKAG